MALPSATKKRHDMRKNAGAHDKYKQQNHDENARRPKQVFNQETKRWVR